MKRVTLAGAVLMALLVVFLHASVVVVVEVPDDDAKPAVIKNVIDGDTVELLDRRVRLVGYDAYELSEPLGQQARQELRSLCPGETYLDVDDLEPQDRYGRTLGYMWCRRSVGNVVWHISVQKHFIVGDGRTYVKRLLHIPPDEHPYTLWMIRHVVKFDRAVEIYVYNDTKSPHRIYGDAVVLTSGVYEIYYNSQLVARLRLMNHTATTINLPIANTAETQRTTAVMITSTATLNQTVALRETTTAVVAKATITVTNVVKKPYLHPLTYVAIAIAVAVLAVYLMRSKPAARR